MSARTLPCSIKEFSGTVELIYDCVLEPQRWRLALRKIAEITGSPSSSVGVLNVKSGELHCLYDQGYPQGFWDAYRPYAPRHPLIPVLSMLPIGGVTTIANGPGDEEFFGSLVYREFLQPFGYRDCIRLLGMRTGGRVGYISACRKESDPRFSQREIDLFSLFSKFICRVMQVSDLFDLRSLQAGSLEATLDGLAAAVFLVARDLRVVHMNAAAESRVRKGDALRLVNGRLRLADAADGHNFAAALAAAIAEEPEMRGSHSIAIPDNNGGGAIATILPLERREPQSLLHPFSAVAAIFVQDPAVVPILPADAFGKLYGLTGGELRVALKVASGLAPQETAEMLGIGLETVKTHLQHIFQKTGTARQAELVALASRCAGLLNTGSGASRVL
jgi:DNA-binding CsgD family transcriptional regulator